MSATDKIIMWGVIGGVAYLVIRNLKDILPGAASGVTQVAKDLGKEYVVTVTDPHSWLNEPAYQAGAALGTAQRVYLNEPAYQAGAALGTFVRENINVPFYNLTGINLAVVGL